MSGGVEMPVPVMKSDNDDNGGRNSNATDTDESTDQFPNTDNTRQEEEPHLAENFHDEHVVPPPSPETNNRRKRRSLRKSWTLTRQDSFDQLKVGQIPTSDDEDRIVKEHYGADSWQLKVLHVVHSKPVQTTLMLMLLLDVLVLFAELYLQAEFPSCNIISRDAISCCPKQDNEYSDKDSAYGDDHDGHLRFLAGGGSGCIDYNTYESPYTAGCDGHKYPELHTAHVALFGITIGILGCFMIELTLLIVCLSPCTFFSYMFYVVDFLVVFLSFALEVAFHIVSKENLGAAVGMLVVIRLWRFARIGHGLVKAATEAQSAKHKKVLKELENLLTEHNIPFESHLEDQFSKRERSLRNVGD